MLKWLSYLSPHALFSSTHLSHRHLSDEMRWDDGEKYLSLSTHCSSLLQIIKTKNVFKLPFDAVCIIYKKFSRFQSEKQRWIAKIMEEKRREKSFFVLENVQSVVVIMWRIIMRTFTSFHLLRLFLLECVSPFGWGEEEWRQRFLRVAWG